MKPIYFQMAAGLAATFVLGAGSACAQQPAPEPQDEAVAEPENWLDAPQTPGDWKYQDFGSSGRAIFSGQEDDFYFSMTCLLGQERPEILISRTGRPQERELMMTIRTETAQRVLTVEAATPAIVSVALDPSDPLLDAMAITKGRFAIEVEGMAPLYIPAWAEVTRVIEDCR